MKKFLSILLAVLFVWGPASHSTYVAKAEGTATDTEVLKPGLNIWTGTTAVQDFEGDDILDYVILNEARNTTLETRTYDMDSNNVIEDNTAVKLPEMRAYVAAKSFPLIEKERPVSIEFDYIYNDQIRVLVNSNPTRTTLNTHSIVWLYQSPKYTTNWQHFSGVRCGTTDVAENPNGDYRFLSESADLSQIYIASAGDATDTNPVYIDNVSITPYYKISYDLCGGEGDFVDEYFLGDKFEIDMTVTPTRDKATFLGWSLTNGGEVLKTSSVDMTPGKDVTLYAVWEVLSAENAVKYTYNSQDAGIADGTISVTLIDGDKDYTSAEILLADDNGILENYTPFAGMTFTDGIGTYEVSGKRAFPEGATRLAAKLSGEGLEDIYYWYTIPEEKRLVFKEEPRFTFWALSDLHLNGNSYNEDYWSEMTVNRANAMADVMKTDVDFAFINGDLVCYGDTNYLEVLKSYFDDKLNNPEYNKNEIPFFTISGNHEYYESKVESVDNEEIASYYNAQVDWLEENYGDEYSFVKNDGGSRTWYAVDNDNVNMVFLQNPEPDEEFTICEEQLRFLDNQLYNGEKSNKTNFVIIHRPLANTIPNSSGGYVYGSPTTTEVNKILAKHPNTIVFSAHTHSDLSSDKAHFTVVNDMTTTPSHINDGSLVNTHIFGSSDYHMDFSTGVYLEVYNDKIYVRSRRFAENSVYFGHGVYIIDTPDASKELFDVSLTGEMKDGAVFTAYVNGEVPADDAPYTYEWSVRNEIISREKSFEIDVKGYYADEYVALRVYDKDGNFASCITEKPFEGVNITYELTEDATGNVPPSRTWIRGTYMQPEIGVAFPQKDGKFFKGWSTQKNATTPMAEVLIEGATTYYPVFDDVPEFHFDANLSGFATNGVASEVSITDGILNVKVNGGRDPYFIWSNSSFDGDKYKYMRIKSEYVSGSPDSVYFGTAADSGRSAQRGIQIKKGTVMATVDGMDIREYDLKAINANWTGTITKLWYDLLAADGDLNVDYIIFSDKRGIYTANIAYSGESASVEGDANFKIGDVSADGSLVRAKLVPDEGYEFAPEILKTALVNGIKATYVSFDESGNVIVEFPVTDTAVWVGKQDSPADKYTINVGTAFAGCDVIVAAYDSNRKLIAAGTAFETNDADGLLTAYVEKTLGAAVVKVFVFEKGSIKPVSSKTIMGGNLLVNGDAEDLENANVGRSDNAIVTIVNDSEKGNVWDVAPKRTSDWIYYMYGGDFNYVPGATYEATVDVKVLPSETSGDITVTFHTNAQYKEIIISNGEEITVIDHVINSEYIESGKWKSVKIRFKIPETATDRSKDKFTFYIDPVGGESVHYMLDNIDLRIIE